MSRLTPIERECQDILSMISDYIAPGQRKLGSEAYLEIAGLVRMCLTHLRNKEFGCSSGKHSGNCICTDDSVKGRIH